VSPYVTSSPESEPVNHFLVGLVLVRYGRGLGVERVRAIVLVSATRSRNSLRLSRPISSAAHRPSCRLSSSSQAHDHRSKSARSRARASPTSYHSVRIARVCAETVRDTSMRLGSRYRSGRPQGTARQRLRSTLHLQRLELAFQSTLGLKRTIDARLKESVDELLGKGRQRWTRHRTGDHERRHDLTSLRERISNRIEQGCLTEVECRAHCLPAAPRRTGQGAGLCAQKQRF